MSLSYQFVKTFKDANMAICGDMPCGADYPYPEFDIDSINKKEVVLKGHYDNKTFTFLIHKGTLCEYVFCEQSSAFEKMLNRKPTKFKVYPIKGEYI